MIVDISGGERDKGVSLPTDSRAQGAEQDGPDEHAGDPGEETVQENRVRDGNLESIQASIAFPMLVSCL